MSFEFRYKELLEIDSTNNYMRKWMQDEPSLPELSVLRALYQTAGRGQVGNRWESERGKNLTMSLLLRPEGMSVHRQFDISMVIAVSVAQALQPYLQEMVKVKWPNDIYVGDRKMAGILIENVLRGCDIMTSVAGIGVNVNQQIFLSDAPNPVSLRQIVGYDVDISTLMQQIVAMVEIWMAKLRNGGVEEIHRTYIGMMYRADGALHNWLLPTGEVLTASIVDTEPTGHIILRDFEGREYRFAFKEVSHMIV
ncbi:MAG: biotin--[acetyl-CoA-carboxylase] ligase [Marinilabiliaceae bacterium]|nr:biotin--[acetyl-CoA-carboxylase] ligase [Marinilabiliaceae bacterium]